MIKKTITYTDYKGNERTEDFWFNLTKAELMEMELTNEGGLSDYIDRIVKSQNTSEIVAIFKRLILKAYGEKSEDGRRFMKGEDISKAFSETEAYSELFMELATDADKASAFVNGIIPDLPNVDTPVALPGKAPVEVVNTPN